jgi:hypothetical protein
LKINLFFWKAMETSHSSLAILDNTCYFSSCKKFEHYPINLNRFSQFVSDHRQSEVLRQSQMENFSKYSTTQVCRLMS